MIKTAVDTNINLKVANVYKPLWKNAKRRNYIYGGRGSGKSHDVAEYCLFRAYQSKIKVLCTRELQNSIAADTSNVTKGSAAYQALAKATAFIIVRTALLAMLEKKQALQQLGVVQIHI